ncbi:MAG: hypothetical protein QXP16_01265 [Candidatus Bathyarchaeia archaeon]
MFDGASVLLSGRWKPQMKMLYRIVKPLLEKGKMKWVKIKEKEGEDCILK